MTDDTAAPELPYIIDLANRREQPPYDLDLVPGISVTVRPVTRPDMTIARAVATERLKSIKRQYEDLMESGYPLGDMPDFSVPGVEDGVYEDLVVKELACRHIVGWSGIGLNGELAEPTRENIAAAIDIQTIGERFYAKLLVRQAQLDLAKKGSRPPLNGSSDPAVAAAIAEAAAKAASPAPTDDRAQTDGTAPTTSTEAAAATS